MPSFYHFGISYVAFGIVCIPVLLQTRPPLLGSASALLETFVHVKAQAHTAVPLLLGVSHAVYMLFLNHRLNQVGKDF